MAEHYAKNGASKFFDYKKLADKANAAVDVDQEYEYMLSGNVM
jgi:hypothetical protein